MDKKGYPPRNFYPQKFYSQTVGPHTQFYSQADVGYTGGGGGAGRGVIGAATHFTVGTAHPSNTTPQPQQASQNHQLRAQAPLHPSQNPLNAAGVPPSSVPHSQHLAHQHNTLAQHKQHHQVLTSANVSGGAGLGNPVQQAGVAVPPGQSPAPPGPPHDMNTSGIPQPSTQQMQQSSGVALAGSVAGTHSMMYNPGNPNTHPQSQQSNAQVRRLLNGQQFFGHSQQSAAPMLQGGQHHRPQVMPHSQPGLHNYSYSLIPQPALVHSSNPAYHLAMQQRPGTTTPQAHFQQIPQTHYQPMTFQMQGYPVLESNGKGCYMKSQSYTPGTMYFTPPQPAPPKVQQTPAVVRERQRKVMAIIDPETNKNVLEDIPQPKQGHGSSPMQSRDSSASNTPAPSELIQSKPQSPNIGVEYPIQEIAQTEVTCITNDQHFTTDCAISTNKSVEGRSSVLNSETREKDNILSSIENKIEAIEIQSTRSVPEPVSVSKADQQSPHQTPTTCAPAAPPPQPQRPAKQSRAQPQGQPQPPVVSTQQQAPQGKTIPPTPQQPQVQQPPQGKQAGSQHHGKQNQGQQKSGMSSKSNQGPQGGQQQQQPKGGSSGPSLQQGQHKGSALQQQPTQSKQNLPQGSTPAIGKNGAEGPVNQPASRAVSQQMTPPNAYHINQIPTAQQTQGSLSQGPPSKGIAPQPQDHQLHQQQQSRPQQQQQHGRSQQHFSQQQESQLQQHGQPILQEQHKKQQQMQQHPPQNQQLQQGPPQLQQGPPQLQNGPPSPQQQMQELQQHKKQPQGHQQMNQPVPTQQSLTQPQVLEHSKNQPQTPTQQTIPSQSQSQPAPQNQQQLQEQPQKKPTGPQQSHLQKQPYQAPVVQQVPQVQHPTHQGTSYKGSQGPNSRGPSPPQQSSGPHGTQKGSRKFTEQPSPPSAAAAPVKPVDKRPSPVDYDPLTPQEPKAPVPDLPQKEGSTKQLPPKSTPSPVPQTSADKKESTPEPQSQTPSSQRSQESAAPPPTPAAAPPPTTPAAAPTPASTPTITPASTPTVSSAPVSATSANPALTHTPGEGKKLTYDLDFLFDLRNSPLSQERPESLPDLEVVLHGPNKPIDPKSKLLTDFMQFFVPTVQRPKMPASFMQPKVYNKKSQQGGFRGMQKVIDIRLSMHADIRLKTAENAWKPSSKQDHKSDKDLLHLETIKKMRGILNKLTPDNFDRLVEQVKNMKIENFDTFKAVIDLIFEKAVDEQAFSTTYAKLCKVLSVMSVKAQGKGGDETKFRNLMISKCQTEFEKDKSEDLNREEREKEIGEVAEFEKKMELRANLEYDELRLRKRSVGNIRFIGELYKQKTLTSTIMMKIIIGLLTKRDEESLECLCKLLTTIGKMLEISAQSSKKAQEELNEAFNEMRKLVNSRTTSSRVRFLMMDVIDLRNNNWIPRREDAKPKTKAQVHEEIRKEEIQQQILLNSSVPRKDDRERKRSRDNRSLQTEEGWTNVLPSTRNNREPFQASRLKNTFTRNPLSDNQVNLRPGISMWATGSSGGINNPENDSRSVNMYSVLDCSSDNKRLHSFGPRLAPSGGSSHHRQVSGSFGSKSMPPPSEKESLPTYKAIGTPGDRSKSNSRSNSRTGSRDGSLTADAMKRDRPPLPAMSSKNIQDYSESIIAEYAHNNYITEAVECIHEKFDGSNIAKFIGQSLEWVIDKNAESRKRVGILYHHLLINKHVTTEQFEEGCSEIMEMMSDFEIDIPCVCAYMGEILCHLLKDNCMSIEDIRKLIQDATPLTATILAKTLKLASLNLGEQQVVDMWKTSELSWKNLLFGADAAEFFSKHDIEFLNLDTSISSPISEENFDPKLVRRKLKSMFKTEASEEKIFGFIETNYGPFTKTQKFVRALTIALVDSLLVEESPGSFLICDNFVDKLRERVKFVHKYVENHADLELACIYGMQALSIEYQHPSGMMEKLFNLFYDTEVLTEDSFLEWMKDEDPEGQYGKGVCLTAAKHFLEWLQDEDDNAGQ